MVPLSLFSFINMPKKTERDFEARHLGDIKTEQLKIRNLYEKAIADIYKITGIIKFNGGVFNITRYPSFSKKVDDILLTLSKNMTFTLINGAKGQWNLAVNKNAAVIHKNYGSGKISRAVNRMIYDPQEKAMEEFIHRKINGLGLSDRVWKYTNQFRTEIEQNLFAGLSEGRSAAAMARDQAKYLEMPDMLYRRVRDASVKTSLQKRELVLSPDAKRYKPGKGIYRSSYKNAMRLTRDTNNDSYRQSDMVRYKTLPFILGYNVNLSNRHPITDICDDLQGTYPVTFVWLKWHNQCICSCTSKLASPEEYARYEQSIIDGTSDKFIFTGRVNELPANFNSYVESKQGSMDNWKRKPEWVLQNNVKI